MDPRMKKVHGLTQKYIVKMFENLLKIFNATNEHELTMQLSSNRVDYKMLKL